MTFLLFSLETSGQITLAKFAVFELPEVAIEPTFVCTIATSGCSSSHFSIFPAASFDTSKGAPGGSLTLTYRDPVSLWGTKLKGVRGARKSRVPTKNTPAPIRIQTPCLRTASRPSA